MDFKELGKQIASNRKEQHISQEILSSNLGFSRVTLSSLENGNVGDIGIKKVLQIIDYLGFEFVLKEKSSFPTFEELVDER